MTAPEPADRPEDEGTHHDAVDFIVVDVETTGTGPRGCAAMTRRKELRPWL